MTHKILFENGETVDSYYTDYITLMSWEKMYKSRIKTIDGKPIIK
jgi:hypothetical protein